MTDAPRFKRPSSSSRWRATFRTMIAAESVRGRRDLRARRLEIGVGHAARHPGTGFRRRSACLPLAASFLTFRVAATPVSPCARLAWNADLHGAYPLSAAIETLPWPPTLLFP
jgi:hypothetical protein